MARKENQWFTCLWNIVKATLVSLGGFIFCAIVIAAVLAEIENQIIRDCIAYALTMACYAVSFYRFHMFPRISTYAEHTGSFDLKAELRGFLRADGKVLLIIYGIAAAATEISWFIFPSPTPNPIATACLCALGPFCAVIPVYVARSLVGFVYASAVLFVLTLLRSRRIYKDDLTANARRRER